MKPSSVLLSLTLLAGCASAPPVDKEPWPEVTRPRGEEPAPPPTTIENPEALAQPGRPAPAPRLSKSDLCEADARRLLGDVPDRAWETLRGCIGRGDFTKLAVLLEDPWVSELRTRKDAALVLGRLVAGRGGDILGDLAKLRGARIPLFGLKTAMENPRLYKGRMVLFRARVQEVKPLASNQSSARLAQVDLVSQETFVNKKSVRLKTSDSGSASAHASGSYEGGRNGRRGSGSGSASGSISGSSSSVSTLTLETGRFDNGLVETGRIALARLGSLDPFFEPGLDFIIVARFDGVRTVPGANEDSQETNAVVTVFGYFEASPILAE